MERVSNEELIRKAVITTDALATAGKLNPAQADKFIDYVVDESVLKNNARIERFRNEQMDIEKVGVGVRVAVPKAEAADPGIRRGITTSKISLQPKVIMVPFEIGDEFIETNIEGESMQDHIIKMMARRLANDLEELYLLGDLLGHAAIEADIKGAGETAKYVKDSYLALGNGWIRRADSAHIHDAEGSNIGLSVFSAMLRQMPTKFRRNKRDLRFYMSSDLAQIYIEKLATRATALGDAAAAGGSHTPFGVQIVEVPLLPFLVPVVEHVVLSGTTAVSLRYAPIQDVVVTTSTLTYETPESAYISATDYNLDLAAGTIARDAGGSIGDGDTVKVTYNTNPQVLLTHYMNFIVGIGRDIRIEKDRDIYKSVNQYAITCKVDTQFEETDAVVKAQNVGQGI